MVKLKRMLGDIDDPTVVVLMALIESQSAETLANWSLNYVEQNLLSIYQYNEWYLDNFTDPKNPQVKSLIPADYCGIFSSQMQGFMGYGVNAIIDNVSKEFVSIEGTRCPDSWIQKKPAAKYIQLMSRPLSCPVEVDAWFISKVV